MGDYSYCLHKDIFDNAFNIDKKMEEFLLKVPLSQILIYNIKGGWKPLCDFIGCDIPKHKEFPKRNSGIAMSAGYMKHHYFQHIQAKL